ncbi:ATP-dependent RNA helicase DeaD [Caprobacter fermentans]|uniref:ATP-dependent RNA helicase DeaD n=1 Tax=Caproicibacter fermentans TaxID=2576756 RepID=A0A6N8HW11_9FIRM|nr:DEAD/DEAH box helicase [Caproicibacter fermentans]MVB09991.1 ATP-dependent RNA helicase DeaD [Caproicibacter fermentans]QNK42062.1 DEAD/DEAH box helicase [Caproicibacter fermentans]
MQFKELNLLPEILRAVEEMGYTSATDIQSGSIPLILEGRDLIGRSSTGTGKTAAFGIPVVQMTALGDGSRGQALILSPTRELAMQISDEIHKYSKYLSRIGISTVCGGQSMPGQIHQLKTAQIVIGTPGRVMDHLRRRTLTLDNLRTVVLDEADEMLNMGFLEDIQTILKQAPEKRQTVLFSATIPPAIMAITKDFQTDPAMVAVDGGQKTVDGISQFYYRVPQKDKVNALKLLLEYHRPKRALIFCNTKKMVEELCTDLNDSGFQAAALHGDMKQSQRTQVMNDFKHGRSSLLIATDVAARGIDVEDIDAVFNFDIPQENEYYIHRIGRTGRAGRTGSSHTLAANRSQMERMRSLERFMNAKISEAAVPDLEEIHERRLKKFLGNLKELADENSGETWIPYLKSLEEQGYSPLRVAAALCTLTAGKNRRLDSVRNIRRVQPEPEKTGTMRVHADIGTNDKIRPEILIAEIAAATGLPVGAIGKINIYREYATIELSEKDAALVARKMSAWKFRQRTVHFTVSGKTGQQERRQGTPKKSWRGQGKGGAPYRGRRTAGKK